MNLSLMWPETQCRLAKVKNRWGRLYLKAVLVWHELLSFALVGGLGAATGALGGQRTPGGPVGTFTQVELRHLNADLITHNVLELGRGEEMMDVNMCQRGHNTHNPQFINAQRSDLFYMQLLFACCVLSWLVKYRHYSMSARRSCEVWEHFSVAVSAIKKTIIKLRLFTVNFNEQTANISPGWFLLANLTHVESAWK